MDQNIAKSKEKNDLDRLNNEWVRFIQLSSVDILKGVNCCSRKVRWHRSKVNGWINRNRLPSKKKAMIVMP